MIKLNLGCGDKILQGYINVDVASERAGKKPDVVSDISERLNIDFINSHFRKERYKLPRHERYLINQIPDIVRDIFSIEFFDSVIAIKKRTKIEPLRIRK